MKYYVWKGYFPGSGNAFAESRTGLNDDDAGDILIGAKLAKPPKKVVVTELSEGELPDLLESAWSSKIVSEALKKILEKQCPDCIQYIPVQLDEYRGEKYWIANILTKVSVLDREKSKVTNSPRRPESIRTISKMVLKPLGDDTPAIFHMAELLPVILVSETLRKELEAASSTAGRFIKAEDYRHPPKY